MDSDYNLKRYLNISSHLGRLEQEKKLISQELYTRSLCTGIAFDELSIHAKAPKIECLILDSVEACMLIDLRIKRWKLRQRYFHRFLDQLTVIERESLLTGGESLETRQLALDEIHEIETAIAFIYGYEPPRERIELTGNVLEDINLMSEVFT